MALVQMITAKGKVVNSDLTDDQAIAILKTLRSRFAIELAEKVRSKRGLSRDQMIWVHALAVESLAPKDAAPILDVTGILDLFAKAAEHLQRPAIRLLIEVEPLRISLAPQGSKYAGELILTNGESYESRLYYGRIDREGKVHLTSRAPSGLLTLLGRFAKDPTQVALEYGRLTGACCFCSRPLCDERSTTAGYGPICASRWSLPWS